MGEVYKMIAVRSKTKEILDRDLQSLQVASGYTKTTFDDLIQDMRSRLLELKK